MSTHKRLLATALAVTIALTMLAPIGAASTTPGADGAPLADTPASGQSEGWLLGVGPPGDDGDERTPDDDQRAPDDDNETRPGPTEPPERTARGKPPSNLTSDVAELVDRARESPGGLQGTTVTVRFNAKDGMGDRAERLADRVGEVRSRAGTWIVVELSAAALLEVKDNPALRYVQRPVVPEPTAGDITSEGIYNISADEVHAAGYEGDNATVAVIDLRFNANNDEIADNVVETRDMTDGSVITNTSGNHGTAVSEIVVDTAPNVSLILLKIETITEWRNAIDYAEKADVQVASLGISTGPFDGSGALGDEMAEARANGTSSFISAGNAGGGKHLNLTWSDGDADDLLNFDGSDERLGITTRARSVSISVSWNDYPGSDQDYDLFLYDDSGTQVDSSTTSQTGSQDPEESVRTSAGDCPCELEIERVSADGTADFDLFANDGTTLEYSTRARSLTRPATDEASITVGAVYFGDLTLEGYSSRGPTIDGRLKPEFTAPAQVSTSVYGSEGFAGTSAAAPHAAGAAALLVDANGSIAPDYTEKLLKDTARQTDGNYDSPDPNNQMGHGLINVSAALEQMQASQNGAPTASDDAYATDEDTTLSASAPGVLGNDSDPDGDSLTASLVSGPDHGSLTLNADGSFTYDPDSDYSGADSFTYEVADGNGGTDRATVSLTVNAVNDAPTANDDAHSTDEDVTLSVSAPGVLGNDSDPEGDSLTASLVSGPDHGTLSLNADGSFTYDPSGDYNGADSFTYEVADGNGGTDRATVSLTVNAVNDAPSAANESYVNEEDTRLSVSAPGVLDNDEDVDGDGLSASVVSGPDHGTLSLNANGSFTYDPATDYVGRDSFTYEVADGSGATDTATVTVDVTDSDLLTEEWNHSESYRLQGSAPALNATHAFVGGLGTDVVALDRSSGAVAWRFARSGSLVDSSPTLTDGRVIIGSGSGTVYAINTTTGTPDWTNSTDSAVVSSPVVDDGTVFVGSNDGGVLALNASTGAVEWTRDVGDSVFSQPAVAGGRVFVTTDDGAVVALDRSDGSEDWRRDTGAELDGGSPLVANGTLFVAADDLYALDPASGSVQWQASDYGGTAGSTPAYDASLDLVVVGSADRSVYAFEPDGTLSWSYETGNSVRSVTVAGDRVVVGSDDARTYLLDGANGTVLGAAVTGSVSAKPIVDGNVVYVSSGDGNLMALSNVTSVTSGPASGGPTVSPDPVRPGPGSGPTCENGRSGSDANTGECGISVPG